MKKIPLAYLFFSALFIAELMSILFLNHGHFTYSLDDPYIHMAMAENLQYGHYGINSTEFSAPSSSIIWPLLLAPFMSLPFANWVPLMINLAVSLLTLWLLKKTLCLVFQNRTTISVLLCSSIIALNLVGLSFTGMEHSLQLLAAVAVVHGLTTLLLNGTGHALLYSAIILGPLIRYENLALSLPACLIIWLTHSRKTATLVGFSTLLPLAAFSIFLHHNGIGLLPSSVLAKSNIMAEAGSLETLLTNLKSNFFEKRGRGLLFLGATILLIRHLLRANSSSMTHRLSLFAICSTGLHLLIGRMGWFSRYEIYAWAAVLLTIVIVYSQSIANLLNRLRWPLTRHATGLIVSVFLCPAYAFALLMTPLGSNNIYEQQYQMHRFITEFWRGPVAANDIGYISFQNPDHYILDVWGLGSYTALRNRKNRSSEWMTKLAREEKIAIAIVYSDIGIPEDWNLVGTLRLAHRRTTVHGNEVGFYAINPSATKKLVSLMNDFSTTLPPGVSLTFQQKL